MQKLSAVAEILTSGNLEHVNVVKLMVENSLGRNPAKLSPPCGAECLAVHLRARKHNANNALFEQPSRVRLALELIFEHPFLTSCFFKARLMCLLSLTLFATLDANLHQQTCRSSNVDSLASTAAIRLRKDGEEG